MDNTMEDDMTTIETARRDAAAAKAIAQASFFEWEKASRLHGADSMPLFFRSQQLDIDAQRARVRLSLMEAGVEEYVIGGVLDAMRAACGNARLIGGFLYRDSRPLMEEIPTGTPAPLTDAEVMAE